MKRLVLVLLLTSATARAAEVVTAPAESNLPLLVSLDAETIWHLDPNYRVFSGDRADGGGGASVRYDVHRLARGILAIGAGLHARSNTATLGGSQQLSLSVLTPSLSATLHWRVHRWIEPHVRVAVDGSWGTMSVSPNDYSGAALSGHSFSPGGSAGAGLTLRTSTITTALSGFGFAFAFTAEGGFHVGAPFDFTMAPTRPADDTLARDHLPATGPALGTLGRSQPYLRLSAAVLL